MGYRKRQKTSLAWNQFIQLEKEERCKQCGVVVSTKNGTSGLLKHLMGAHKINGYRRKTKATDPLRDLKEDVEEEEGMGEEEDGELPTGSSGRRLRSPVWKYFVPLEENRSAKCKLCQVVMMMSRGSSTSALSWHLDRAHNINLTRPQSDPLREESSQEQEVKEEPEDVDEVGEDGKEDDTNSELEEPLDKRRRLQSSVWQYFVKVGESGQEARCNLCQKVMKARGGNTTGLIRHLAIHKIQIRRCKPPRRGQLEPEPEPNPLNIEEEEVDTAQKVSGVAEDKEESDAAQASDIIIQHGLKQGKLRSSVWKYFIPMRDGEGNSKCKICKLLVKSKVGTSGLGRHLQRVHGITTGAGGGSRSKRKDKIFFKFEPSHEGPRQSRGLTSSVWQHFVPVVYKSTAKCRRCLKVVKTTGGTTSGLGRHLAAVHGIRVEGWNTWKANVRVKEETVEDEWENEMEDSLSVKGGQEEVVLETCFGCDVKFDSSTLPLPKLCMKEYRFLLMELMEISAGDSLNYLEQLERPERWLALCGPCQSVVGEGVNLRKEITRLERKLEKCQGTFLKRMRSKMREGLSGGEHCPGEKRQVLEKMKIFVRNRNYAVLEEEEEDKNIEEVRPSYGGNEGADLEPDPPQSPRTEASSPPPPSPPRNIASYTTRTQSKLLKRSRICLNRRKKEKKNLPAKILSPVEQCRKHSYDCGSCPGVKNYSLTKFAMHLVLHQRRPYQCSVCSEFLSAENDLREQHWLDKHPTLLLTPDSERFLQVNGHPAHVWKCEKISCPAGFSTEEERDEHEQSCLIGTAPKKKPYACKFSEDLRFRNIPEWRIHRALNHPEVDRISCYYCNESFSEKTVEGMETRHDLKMQQHMSQVHGVTLVYEECETCGIVYDTVAERKVHLLERHQVPTEQLYSCWICHQTNYNLTGLRRHISYIHFPRTSSICELCGDKYIHPESFTHHKYVSHGLVPEGGKVTQCPEPGCGFKSIVGTKVSHHFRQVHEAERNGPFVCPTCGKSFRLSSRLKYHSEIHHNEGTRPYQCEICGSAFAVKMYLTIHKKKKHGLGGGTVARKRFRYKNKDQEITEESAQASLQSPQCSNFLNL